MYLVWDSETGGFAENRLLQLGMILVDENHKAIMEANLLIKPAGWTIEPGAEAVHGISQGYAEKHGIEVERALMLWVEMTRRADVLVCHNVEFDRKVVEGELDRIKWPRVKNGWYCTMEGLKGVCRIPASEKQRRAGFGEWKRPKLVEAYGFAFGEGFEGAHDAMADCRATARLFEWIKQGQPKTEELVVVGGSEPNKCVPAFNPYSKYPPPPPAPQMITV